MTYDEGWRAQTTCRQIAVIDPAGRHVADQDARGGITTYSFDPAGRRVALVDANGNAWGNGDGALCRAMGTEPFPEQTGGQTHD